MKLILLKDVPKIGHKGDVVTVADGHAANFLIPRKLALPANAALIAEAERMKEQNAKDAETRDAALAATLKSLSEKSVTLAAKADESGSLFKGIHEKEIVDALKAQHGVEIDAALIILEAPLKHVGEHAIPVVAGAAKGTLPVIITKEE